MAKDIQDLHEDLKKKNKSFWSDFKAFISRGNVVDMAVGVVIGGAFGKIVTGLVNYIINPFIGIFIKAGSLDKVHTLVTPVYQINDAGAFILDEAGEKILDTAASTYIEWGMWIQTIIDFLITAFCIFAVLRVLMRSKERLEAKKVAAEKAAAEKKKAEEDAKAAAAAEAQAKADAEKAAKDEKLYQSILRQTELLETLAKK